MTKWCCIAAIALIVAGCAGGGGPSDEATDKATDRTMPVEPAPGEPVSSALFSDLLFSGPGYTDGRVEEIECTADLSRCSASFGGDSLSFSANPDTESEGTAHTALGPWNHMHTVVVDVAVEGLEGKLAASRGEAYAGSLPVSGPATWQGEMLALDGDNQVVRGGATLTIDDLAAQAVAVDVELTPEGHAAMVWDDLPVTDGGFSARNSETDYIRGEFYGPEAQEVGGVFERNRLLGAFGAKR